MGFKLASVEKRFAGIETYFAEFETVGLLLLGFGVIRPHHHWHRDPHKQSYMEQ